MQAPESKLRTVVVTRYVTPLREGGSVPAIVEADDDGMYVIKFRGAGQGPKALIAELVAGEIGRAAQLPVPDIVLIELDPDLARTEPDPEIQVLIRGSQGINVALDYLPGAVMFDPVVRTPDAELASKIVWFDAYVTNVDRTARNTNLLVWHRELKMIDHGAALYFHHDFERMGTNVDQAFTPIRDHVLLPVADRIADVDAALAARIAPELARIVALVPDAWLADHAPGKSPDEVRATYLDHLTRRLAARDRFVQEAIRARAQHL